MKKWMLLLMFVPLMFASCQKKGVSPLLNVIPKDAKMVLAIDNKQLIEKGGFDKLSQFKFYQDIVESLDRNENKDFILNILNNPNKRGLNIDQAYFFIEMQDENIRGVYVACMKDQTLFEQNLHKLIGSDMPEIQDKLSYKMIDKDDDSNGCIVWNDKLFFAFIGDTEGVNFDYYFRLPEEDRLMNVPDFNNFSQRSSDISLWFPIQMYANLSELIKSYYSMDIPIMDDMADINIHAYLDFNNDEIKAELIMTPEESVDAFYEKYPIMKWESDQNMLKDFPQTSYLAFKMALNFPQYIKMMKQAFSAVGVSNYEMEQVVEVLENSEVNAVLNVLGGDIMFSLYGFAEGPMSMPLLGLSLTINSEADFQKLLTMIPGDIVDNVGSYYEINFGVAAAYFAYKDNRLFITADEKSIANFLAGGNAKNIASNATIGNAMKTSPSLFYINLNLDEYPKAIRDLLNMSADQRILSGISILKDFSMGMNSKYNSQASLKFKSGKENSLKQLVKLIESVN
ncbi:MAG: DUF4836 family protein [Prevotellaceae bacterium]|nr:DUF4836 family protein [Prevotellaceae bacterium]